MSPPISEAFAEILRSDALAAAFIIGTHHSDVLRWVAGTFGAEPPPPRRKSNGAARVKRPVRRRKAAVVSAYSSRRRAQRDRGDEALLEAMKAAFKLGSFLRQSRLAHAFENRLKLGQKPLIFAPRGQVGPKAGDGEGRVEREAGIDCRTRLVKPTKLRQGGAHRKILMRIISVGLDRPSKPRDRLLPKAEKILRDARLSHPGIGHRIARTEPEGLDNVSLGFFGATDEDLTKSNRCMGGGEISIQLQYMLTLGNALRSALGHYVDKSQVQMAERMVRDRGQGFGQLRFGRREGRHGTGDKEICALDRVRARRSNERVDIAGIGGERAIEKALRLRQVVAGYTLVEPCQTLKIEVH